MAECKVVRAGEAFVRVRRGRTDAGDQESVVLCPDLDLLIDK